MLRDEIGLQLHGRFSQIAQVFATEQDQVSCDTIMNLVGSYDGVKREYHILYSIINKIHNLNIYIKIYIKHFNLKFRLN